MTCSDFLDGFSDYIDGIGDDTRLDAARTHRDACRSCHRYEEVFLRGRELLRGEQALDVPEDFHPRLQHRLYHVDDERALARAPSGSATLLLTVAAALTVAAWSPSFLDDPEIELSPIVVSRPAPRPFGIRLPNTSVLPSISPAALDREGDDLWRQPSALFFEYAPIRARYRRGFLRTGLQ
jgi:anti-sigma factor RsiW